MAAVPGSLRRLPVDGDQEGNSLFRFVVLQTKVEEYLTESRKHGWNTRRFVYDLQQFLKDQETRTKLEERMKYLTAHLASRSYYAFSELFIALMHLKVMRTYIDGVLRFGIPP